MVGRQLGRLEVVGAPPVLPLVGAPGDRVHRRRDDDHAALGLDVDAGVARRAGATARRVGAVEQVPAAATGDPGDGAARQAEVVERLERVLGALVVQVDVDDDQAVAGEHADVAVVVDEPAPPVRRVTPRAGRPVGVERRFAVHPDERRHPERLLEVPAHGHVVGGHGYRSSRGRARRYGRPHGSHTGSRRARTAGTSSTWANRCAACDAPARRAR